MVASSQLVDSSKGDTQYMVTVNDLNEWSCTCPQFIYRHKVCKHILKVQSEGMEPPQPEPVVDVEQHSLGTCAFCHKQMNIVEQHEYGKVCQSCRRKDPQWYLKLRNLSSLNG